MGWGTALLFGSLGQQVDIDALQQAVIDQEQRDRTQDEQIRWLSHENQQLKLAVAALVRLLVSKGAPTPQEAEALGRAIERSAPPEP